MSKIALLAAAFALNAGLAMAGDKPLTLTIHNCAKVEVVGQKFGAHPELQTVMCTDDGKTPLEPMWPAALGVPVRPIADGHGHRLMTPPRENHSFAYSWICSQSANAMTCIPLRSFSVEGPGNGGGHCNLENGGFTCW